MNVTAASASLIEATINPNAGSMGDDTPSGSSAGPSVKDPCACPDYATARIGSMDGEVHAPPRVETVGSCGRQSNQTCGDSSYLMVCAVGTQEFGEPSGFAGPAGVKAAWDKMASIVFAGYSEFAQQTSAFTPANNAPHMVWLECWMGGDPFAPGAPNPLEDFQIEQTAVYPPCGMNCIMHLFRSIQAVPNDGTLGEGWCPDQWSYGDYQTFTTNATGTVTDLNIFLHEVGHNFKGSHETGDYNNTHGITSGHTNRFCGNKYARADWF